MLKMKKWAIVDEEGTILETFWTEADANLAFDECYDDDCDTKLVEVDYSIEQFEEDWKNGTFDTKWIADRLWNNLLAEEKEAFIEDNIPYYF